MGRAGRRSILEDGERMLYRCIVMRPESIAPRLMLMSNLLFQARYAQKLGWLLTTTKKPLLGIQTSQAALAPAHARAPSHTSVCTVRAELQHSQ